MQQNQEALLAPNGAVRCFGWHGPICPPAGDGYDTLPEGLRSSCHDRGYRAITQRNGRPAMSGTNDTPSDDDSLEMVEVETEGVDEEGNLVIDDLVVAVDVEGKVLATDETVAVITPEGDAVVDEKLSVLGEDGKLHAVEEDISDLGAGSITIAGKVSGKTAAKRTTKKRTPARKAAKKAVKKRTPARKRPAKRAAKR